MKWVPKHMIDKIEKYYRCEVKNTKILRKKLENKRTNSFLNKEKPVWRCILLLKKTTALQPRKEVGWLQSFFLSSPSVSPSSITNLIINSVAKHLPQPPFSPLPSLVDHINHSVLNSLPPSHRSFPPKFFSPYSMIYVSFQVQQAFPGLPQD